MRSDAIVASWLAASFAAAALGAQSYEARGVAGLPEDARRTLAEQALPLWHVVGPEAASIRDVVATVCGDQGRNVNEFLVERAVELNRVATAEYLVEAEMAVAVPLCFRVEESVAVPIEEGDTVEGLLREHYGVYGPLTQERVYKLNADEYPGMTQEEFMLGLQPGTDLLLPYAADRVIFDWSPDRWTGTMSATPYDSLVVDVGGPATSTEIFSRNLTRVPTTLRPDLFQSVPFVEAATAADAGNCGSEPGAFGAGDLAVRYGAEVERLTKAGDALVSVLVGVVDTGLEQNDPFFEGLLAVNEAELDAEDRKDDDDPPNDFVDDVYGVGLASRDGFIYSSATDNPQGHGTKVATIVAAGTDHEAWRSTFPDAGPLLKMVSYSQQWLGPGVDPTVLALAPKYLRREGAAVVNMSLSSSRDTVPLSQEISASEDPELPDAPLFVVAAGNAKSGRGKQLGPHRVFPALYGGRSGRMSETVVTVGAHNGAGELADFSNYSSELVDLLAPGCSVKTRDQHGDVVLENGTSLATAAVSFTAALVRSLGLDYPRRVKNRILASVDYDPDLGSAAWSSGRLNMAKAVSLRYDVLEDGSGIRFGRLVAPGAMDDLCRDRPDPALDNVRKVIPKGERIEFWVEDHQRLHKRECRKAEGELAISFELDGKLVDVPLSDVRDLVPARL